MKKAQLLSVLGLVVAIGLFLGWLLGRSATNSGNEGLPIAERERPVSNDFRTRQLQKPKVTLRDSGKAPFDLEALEAGAIRGERWVSFADRESLDRFLLSLEGRGISVIGSIDALNTLRIRFSDSGQLAGLLDEAEESGLIYPVQVPDVGGGIQEGAIGFGRELLPWLGLDGQVSNVGEGVTVAVLDTGIGAHSAFSDKVKQINLVDLPENPADLNGHGTAVASLIASQMGLAPDASLLSYRVANDNGSSNSFTLAEGIIAAADAGADLINISMGSTGNSSVLRRAIEYAQDSGAVIVASAGNDGQPGVAYPAAYDGVIAVGAVDARGEHLAFSNTGDITLSAPGLDVLSASPGDGAVLFTGTSTSAPVVTGAIAYTMSTRNLGAEQASDMVISYTNDSGAPGIDPSLGEGFVDIGRIVRQDDPTATDAAIASNHLISTEKGDFVQVTVENRGNTTLFNTPVTVVTPAGTTNLNITSLPAGKTHTFDLPLRSSLVSDGQEIRINSNVSLSNGNTDLNPSNNRRIDVITPTASP